MFRQLLRYSPQRMGRRMIRRIISTIISLVFLAIIVIYFLVTSR